MNSDILILNAGSSSIKLTVFDRALNIRLTGAADAIGGAAHLRVGQEKRVLAMADHADALHKIFAALARHGITLDRLSAVGHRVVHGGATLTEPQRITPETRGEIAACIPLAPLHNPHNLAAIDEVARLAPDLPQFASFDTAFHASNPAVATHYALPPENAACGIRRYGFHGLSYSALVRNLPDVTGAALPARVLACHLGNGASLCAIRAGKSVATTMGYSPLEGLTMGTRCGNIDANAVFRLVEEQGLEAARHLLNHGSGLLGLSGHSADMRALSEAGTDASQFAIAHFCYWAARHAGSMIMAMRGCDAVVFTGGIGENAANIRAEILKKMDWLGVELNAARNQSGGPRLSTDGSRVAVWVVAADEEREIARDVIHLMPRASK
ncbi:acetate/propionate family kinase [Roseinatronobacter bogoriensis]|uniref:Acetate kinase n=1 Tax=Roseinatronobacter bogoriensis subsp. barguzinensis TaxID=441209 RepID=A0A2K8KCD6_9RHOB|nr:MULTISPECIES: acetate/propionate family kinase [Rhodobaca]ATX65583.1 acetate/propionate family kinase [Rhodobaca barguzinensis]MBB4208492.1 acetate kinase [Rhodobaca bogoriensis DSM 18756]TDW39131.1 acetate kinase [Rhodobaca barguzinensis]TDY66451.1 acetate kinase [Rhodobaca bogoriensis DSM 18756]